MLSADGFVEPDLVSVRALRVAVGDDLQAAGAGGQGVDPLCEAFVLGGPVADRGRDGDIGAPAPFVAEVAFPAGRPVFGAVDFEQRNRMRIAVRAEDFDGHEPGDRSEGRIGLRTARGQQVTHVPAVRHTRAEDVAAAQTMFFLKVPDQFGEEPHVVDGHIGLKGVTHVPARLAAAVAFALRVADGETVAVGNAVHVEPFRVALSSVAVEDNDQRCAVGQPFGQVEAVGAVDAARTQRVAGRLREAGSRCEKQQAGKGVQEVFHHFEY